MYKIRAFAAQWLPVVGVFATGFLFATIVYPHRSTANGA
jgi:hypothetical protein